MAASAGALVALVFVGLALRSAMRPARADLVAGAGDRMLAALQVPAGRHHAGLTGEWKPAHVAGAPYNGAHYDRVIADPWPAVNLIQDTTMLTTDELTDLLLQPVGAP